MDRKSFTTLVCRAIKAGVVAPHSILWDGKPRVILKLGTDTVRDVPGLVRQLGGRACMYVLDGDMVCSLVLHETRDVPNVFFCGKTVSLGRVVSSIRYPAGSRWVMETRGVRLRWRLLSETPVARLVPAA